jgi:hypothetical protein
MVVSVGGTVEQDPARRALFFQEVLRRVRARPGVETAGAINQLPLAGDIWGLPYFVEGQADGDHQAAMYRVVMPGYFRAMRAPLVHGREITDADNLNAPGVIIINQTVAKKFWPSADPIGKRITMTSSAKNAEWLTVVGVVHDIRQDDWTSELDYEVHLPYLQNRDYLSNDSFAVNYLTLVARTKSEAAAIAPEIKSVIASLDK